MSCPTVTTIQPNECIGNSLEAINNNFSSLQTGICNNINTIIDISNNITVLTSRLETLSGVVMSGAARAWVNFNATKDTAGTTTTVGTRQIRNSYNVSSVLKYSSSVAPGLFEITFTTPFANSNYGVIATCSRKTASNGNYVWAQPSTKDTNFVQIYIHSINASEIADPDYVSVVIL